MTLSANNPMRRALLALLCFEIVVDGLALPIMLILEHVRPALAWGSVGVVIVLALAGAATLRSPLGYWLGWAASLGGMVLGLVSPTMWIVGGLFFVLWIVSFVLGRRIEQAG